MQSNYKEKLRHIKAFVLDVDGVLTNGELYIHPNGTLMRKMNAKDGYILKLAIKLGYKIAIITGGKEEEITIKVGDSRKSQIPSVDTWIQYGCWDD